MNQKLLKKGEQILMGHCDKILKVLHERQSADWFN